MFLSQGYAALPPDSRAHGISGGELVTYGLLEKFDVIAWALWMKQAACRKVYGLGDSLGASILMQAAAVQPAFAAIVAECPYAAGVTVRSIPNAVHVGASRVQPDEFRRRVLGWFADH
jgi:hypothetical protein